VSGVAMDRFESEDVLHVLKEFGIRRAWLAPVLDPTEEGILLDKDATNIVDVQALTAALTTALPHKKVFVGEMSPQWSGSEILTD
jgi:hypothetical protein